MYLIEKQTLTVAAASITFSSIPQTYRHLVLILKSRSDYAATQLACRLRFNGDTGTNYDYQMLRGYATTATAQEGLAQDNLWAASAAAASAPAGVANPAQIYIFDYARTAWQKSTVSEVGQKEGTSSGNIEVMALAGFWRSTAAITSIEVFPSLGNFDTNTTAALYGLKGA